LTGDISKRKTTLAVTVVIYYNRAADIFYAGFREAALSVLFVRLSVRLELEK